MSTAATRVTSLLLPSSALGYPTADRIVAAGEVERVVRVQALHAALGAADAAVRARARVVGGQRGVALRRVPIVGRA